MRISNLFYFLKQGFLGIVRNVVMSSASVLILASSMLVLGSFWMIVTNINQYIDSLDDLNVILVYIDPETDQARTEEIGEELRAMDNVEEVTFISKEEAWKNELQKYDENQRKIFEQYMEFNPLPDTYRVTFKDINRSSALIYKISNLEGIDQELKEQGKNPKSVVDVADKVENFKGGITMISVWLLVILMFVAFLVIINTIRLTVYSRRQEIVIMRYVGATSRFIVAPYVVEGIIIGLLSAGIAFGAQYYLYNYVMLNMLGEYTMSSLIPFAYFRDVLIVGFSAIGLFAGVIASSISMRKYLRV